MTKGLLTPSECITILTSLGRWVSAMGSLGADPYRSANLPCGVAQTALEDILGDGTTSHIGIGASELQRVLTQPLGEMVAGSTYTSICGGYLMGITTAVDNFVRSALPEEWTISGRALGWYIFRNNAIGLVAPTGTPVLSPRFAGAIGNCTAAQAPAVAYTLAQAAGETPPSPAASGVALTGPNMSYIMSIPGVVPPDVQAVRIYRTIVGDPTGTLLYAGQFAVSPGSAYPAIVVEASDSQLRIDVQPPMFASTLVPPVGALAYALGYFSNGQLLDSAMLPATSVVGASGLSSLFGTAPIVMASRIGTTFVSGTARPNSANTGVQGFLGLRNMRVVVTSALSSGTTISNINYAYVSAAGAGTAQIAGPISLAKDVGSWANIPIPSGRIVTAVTGDTAGITSGTYTYGPGE